MNDLTRFRDHARRMAHATHRPECLTRPAPWLKPAPANGCDGCMPAADRVLWSRLADEIDRHLDQPSPPRYDPLPDPVIPTTWPETPTEEPAP